MTKQIKKPMKWNLQFFANPENVNTADLGTIKSIDLVEQFGYSIDELLEVLGITDRITLAQNAKIKTYKWTTTMAGAQVGEGETIPLSKAVRTPDQEYGVPLNKYRKVTTAEAINDHGYDMAVNQTDEKITEEIQEDIKGSFFSFLSTAPTKQTAETLQMAISLGRAKSKQYFPGNTEIVTFVNDMDVAKWLGNAQIQSGPSTAFGLTLLEGFLNQRVLVFDNIPEGKVYSTAAKNIKFASQGVSGNDLARAFDLTTDASGLIGVTHSPTLDNATLQTLVFQGSKLFAEVINGVVETSIVAPEPEEVIPAG